MKQKKIYISGQMTGLKWYEVTKKFREAEKLLHDAGFRVFNPAKRDWQRTLGDAYTESAPPEVGFKGSYREYTLICDLFRLVECDAILLLDNWDKSYGATMEYYFALATNKPVFSSIDVLEAYYECNEKETSKRNKK